MAHEPRPPIDVIVSAMRGEGLAWSDVVVTVDEFVDACSAHEVAPLLYGRLMEAAGTVWPPDLIERLAHVARAEAASELLRRAELSSALAVLAAAHVKPILIKGTPLAYTLYDSPSARPRCDTDLVLARADLSRARDALVAHGYAPTVYCDGELLFRQFELQKVDRFGVTHTLDIHWGVSTQTVFADLLTYDELAAEAVHVPALGPYARAAGHVHALLLACVHPVMHHRNAPRLLWSYDVHLLASRMRDDQWTVLVRCARDRKVAAVVAHSLTSAQGLWRTPVPGAAFEDLAAATGEPSAEYLARNRTWRHELVANVVHLPSWRSRLRLLREVAFPSAEYMSRSYRVTGGVAALLLPALYVHRLAAGASKMLRGKK